MKHGEQSEGENKRSAVRDHRCPWTRDRSDERRENRGQSALAEITEQKARDRDAHLNGGNDSANVGEQRLHDFRAGVAGVDELADTRAADGDERKFSCGEECVHSDEEEDGEEMEDNHCALPSRTRSFILRCCRTDERSNSAAIEGNFSKLCGAGGEICGGGGRTR